MLQTVMGWNSAWRLANGLAIILAAFALVYLKSQVSRPFALNAGLNQ